MKTLKVGDIVVVNLDPTVGDEKQKTRMCVVMEEGGTPLELIIVLPVTEYHPHRSKYFFVPIIKFQEIGLSKPSSIDCYQIRTLSIKRLKRSTDNQILILGNIGKILIDEVRKRLALILDITNEHLSFI